MLHLKRYWTIIRQSGNSWKKHHAVLLSAALSYYTLFSIAPILLIIILIVGSILGEQAVKSDLISRVQYIFGADSAATVSDMIDKIRGPGKGYIATTISLIILFFTSTTLIKNIKKSLNIVWEVRSASTHWIIRQIFDRLVSFVMVLIFGALFLITFIIDTVLVGFGEFLSHFAPHFAFIYLWEGVNFLFSLTFMTFMFAIIFKILPDTKVGWKDVFPGSILTALLFSVAKLLIGYYLGNSQIGTIFGGASSLIVILIWVYYSAQLLFFGAEFTCNYAYQFGSRSRRDENAQNRHGKIEG